MNDHEEEPLLDKLQTALTWLGAILIDATFLIGWVILQWGADKIIQQFPLPTADSWLLPIFQFIFSISTLVAVSTYVIKDIVSRIIIAYKTITNKLTRR